MTSSLSVRVFQVVLWHGNYHSYDLKICVLDKESDVCEGTSKANSGIVHAGHDAKPDTLKAKLNVQGNLMMEEMAKSWIFRLKEMVH